MDHRNGTDRFVICDHLSVGIQNPSSCGLNASFPLMKLFGLTGIVIRLKHHQIDQSASQDQKKEQTAEKDRHYLFPDKGLIFLHKKPHGKDIIIIYSFSMRLFFLFSAPGAHFRYWPPSPVSSSPFSAVCPPSPSPVSWEAAVSSDAPRSKLPPKTAPVSGST